MARSFSYACQSVDSLQRVAPEGLPGAWRAAPVRTAQGPVQMKLLLVTFAFALNSLVFPVLLFLPVLALKGLVPVKAFRAACDRAMVWISFRWTNNNTWLFTRLGGLRLDVDLPEQIELSPKKRYLILPNHQTWTDILVLQAVFHPRTPFLTFFLKSQLRWVPVFGVIWWALGFPYMKRHSAAYLAKHPEKRGQDLETTRRFCQRLKDRPFAIINFVEGTRRTPAKAAKSPFKQLLPPKAGGVAIAMQSLDYSFDHVLDVTITYTSKTISFPDLLAGRVGRVKVEVREVPLASVPRGDYFADEAFAAQFRAWLNQVWEEKDKRLAA